MPCPLCKDGPGDFVVGMMLGHAWGQVVVPDLPNLNLESEEVQKLLSHLVWHAAGPICLNDLSVVKVEVREDGILATPNRWLQPLVDHPEKYGTVTLDEFLEEQLKTRHPLPDGVWDALKKLNDSSSAGISVVR